MKPDKTKNDLEGHHTVRGIGFTVEWRDGWVVIEDDREDPIGTYNTSWEAFLSYVSGFRN